MASGAQLNRWGNAGGVLLLPLLTSASAAVASPLTAYGTTTGPTPNDSGAYVSPIGMSKWTFQIIGAGANAAGYSVTIYGTTDRVAYTAWSAAMNVGGTAFGGGIDGITAGIPASSWQVLPGPSDQSGTGSVTNPMISGSATWFTANIPLVAVRAVLTTIGSPSNSISVSAFAVP